MDSIYGAALYVVLAVIAFGIILFTDAVISPAYVITGAIVGGVVLTIRFVLNRPLLWVYDIVVFLLMFAFATQEITGKLAMVIGLCISTIGVSYFLHHYHT